MINFLKQLLDLIYKKKCYFCGSSKDNTTMCQECFDKINFLPCKPIKTINTIQTYSVTLYSKQTQKMIRGLKYHNQKELAFYQAKLMYDYWRNLDISKQAFIIVPVPMHKAGEKKRKYNHMFLVAQEFATLCGYEVNNELIKRIKNTKPQYKLSKKEREENLDGAFELVNENIEAVKDKNILLIDDILTTGTTLSEMIGTFRSGNVYHLKAFTTSCSEYNIL